MLMRMRWDVSALNLGMIAAYYNISYVTVKVYTLSFKERTKLKGLLEVVSSSAEFETIPIHCHEGVLLRRIADLFSFFFFSFLFFFSVS
ncbi:hypothetical protein AN958_04751 [Leucoagaricus sp. SymC.cos]|nr:hypothetical protein AN958_04751 [Leucoagaricus sp. SymC.cos]